MHDWQAGLAPVYLNTIFASHPILGGTPTVFTIHNIAYQGVFEADWLPRLDLGWEELGVDRLEFWGRISLLKGGINTATLITTVSRRYAEEIQTPEFGAGLEGVLQRRRDRLVGIPNGIDTPSGIRPPTSTSRRPTARNAWKQKTTSKRAVLARYGLPADEAAVARPLVGMISRMVAQKGLDLIAEVADELPRLDATFVVLGTGEAKYQNLWTGMAARHPRKIGVQIGFEEALAHSHRGRRGHLPDAVPVRALWPESAL